MTWNHRVMKATDEHGEHYSIREVFYEGYRIAGWTGPVDPYGETLDELRQNIEWMLSACDLPVLDENELMAMLAERDES